MSSVNLSNMFLLNLLAVHEHDWKVASHPVVTLSQQQLIQLLF